MCDVRSSISVPNVLSSFRKQTSKRHSAVEGQVCCPLDGVSLATPRWILVATMSTPADLGDKRSSMLAGHGGCSREVLGRDRSGTVAVRHSRQEVYMSFTKELNC